MTVPVGRPLKRVRNLQQRLLIERPRHELQPDWKPSGVKATGRVQRGDAEVINPLRKAGQFAERFCRIRPTADASLFDRRRKDRHCGQNKYIRSIERSSVEIH